MTAVSTAYARLNCPVAAVKLVGWNNIKGEKSLRIFVYISLVSSSSCLMTAVFTAYA
jgi:hypothetical protein